MTLPPETQNAVDRIDALVSIGMAFMVHKATTDELAKLKRAAKSDIIRLTTALSEASAVWRSMEDAPRDGTPFYARSLGAYRYQPYKPNSQERKRGTLGRWQSMNEYAGWENCMTPMGDWRPHPDFPARTSLSTIPIEEA